MKRALLVLEDGSYFYGSTFAAEGETFGELVFNTAMTGYQEVLTDPSYAGQIVIMSYPEIGIYGINDSDMESNTVKVAGFVVYRSVEKPSNHRATKSLVDYLRENKIVAIEGIDTRMLIRKIRDKGVVNGAISTQDLDPISLAGKLKFMQKIDDIDLVKNVSVNVVEDNHHEYGWKVAVVDCGCKKSIIRELERLGASVLLVPYTIDFEDLKTLKVNGVLVSNGPGNPAVLNRTIVLIKQILAHGIPLAGICLGHQLLALAVGASTYKMKFGHRGINHPVKDLEAQKVMITTQNHGFAVDPESVGIYGMKNKDQDPGFVFEKIQSLKDLVGKSTEGFIVKITHLSLNDGTVEGLKLVDHPAVCVQFHPEASAGPHDAKDFFVDFMKLVLSR